MKRTIYLARHGETEWNQAGRWQGHTDIPLAESGREQAAALAERLRTFNIASIHTSDLARAWQTAEIVARVLGVPLGGKDPGLRERSFGLFEGLTRRECKERFPREWEGYLGNVDRVAPGGEAKSKVVERMAEAMYRVARTLASSGGAALVVSHGGSMRALLSSAMGAALPPMGNGALFRFSVSLPDGGIDGVEAL